MRSRLARRRRAVLGADRPATSPRCAWLSQTARRPLCRRHRRQSRVVCVGVLDGVHASRRTGFCHCRRNLGGNAHRQWRCVELCRWRFCFVSIHCADADGGVFRFDSAAPTTFTLRAGTSIATLESSLPVQRVSPELNLLARAATFRARLAFAFCRLDRSLPPGLTSLRCRSFS